MTTASTPARVLAALLLVLLAACQKPAAAPSGPPWVRTDFWEKKPIVDFSPFESKWGRPSIQRIAFLGAEEVRDLSKVPAAQLIAFPKRTAGQIRALEQVAGSRLRWHVKLGAEPYFSFIPLGFEKPCPCVYRMGLRDAGGHLKEMYRVPAVAVGPIAQAAVEVDLREYAGSEVDVMLQVDPDPLPPPGQPTPQGSVLWGSPALYGRESAAAPRANPAKHPNILLVGIDTLRADAVGAWGRNPSPTPALDALAGESDVWLDAFTVFNVTNPSFVSIQTGLYGKNHGVYDLRTPLPRSYTPLAKRLAAAGYDTLAVISARHLGDHNSGLGSGFAEVTRADEHFAGELAADMTIDWLAGHAGHGKPFFAWVHLFDPHTPHTPPEPYALGFRPSEATGLTPPRLWVPFRAPGPRAFSEPVLGADRDLYYGEVAYVDRQVGRLLGWLRSRDLLDDTVVAVVADHGESLGEHGIRFRHVGLHDTTTHVPMLIRWPGRESTGRRIHGLVQTIDLFPTLLTAAGLPVPAEDGQDLRTLTGEGKTGRRAVFAEHAENLGAMVRTNEYKYIVSEGNTQFFPDGASLYDLKADPGETRNLVGQGLPAERELADLLARWETDRRLRPAQARPSGLSPEEEQRMQALGYAAAGKAPSAAPPAAKPTPSAKPPAPEANPPE